MSAESLPIGRKETRRKRPDPDFKSGSTHLPGTSPAVDEARGRMMEREQQMQEIGGRIGSALGLAVSHVRGIPGRVRSGLHLVRKEPHQQPNTASGSSSDLADSVLEIFSAGRADAAYRIAEIRETATERFSEMKETAAERVSDWNERARRRIVEARRRAAWITNEYPVETILVCAAVSLGAGFGLRIWRSHRG